MRSYLSDGIRTGVDWFSLFIESGKRELQDEVSENAIECIEPPKSPFKSVSKGSSPTWPKNASASSHEGIVPWSKLPDFELSPLRKSGSSWNKFFVNFQKFSKKKFFSRFCNLKILTRSSLLRRPLWSFNWPLPPKDSLCSNSSFVFCDSLVACSSNPISTAETRFNPASLDFDRFRNPRLSLRLRSLSRAEPLHSDFGLFGSHG